MAICDALIDEMTVMMYQISGWAHNLLITVTGGMNRLIESIVS